MEEPLYISPMQGFCNKVYENDHRIIGWDPNEGEKNFDMIMVVMEDASDVGTGVGRM